MQCFWTAICPRIALSWRLKKTARGRAHFVRALKAQRLASEPASSTGFLIDLPISRQQRRPRNPFKSKLQKPTCGFIA
jgi:hypothetical protein